MVEELAGSGLSRTRVETLPAFVGAGNPVVAPRPGDVETPPGDPRETAAAYAAVEVLREAVDAADAGRRKDAVAAAWHAEPLLRFLSAALGGGSPACG